MFPAFLTITAALALGAPGDRYGDPLPPHAVARLGTLRFRGIHNVYQAASVPGGKQILGMGCGPTVILWDAATGKGLRRFEDSPGKENDLIFSSFAVSPDGKTLAVGTRDVPGAPSPLLLFDLGTGRKLGQWKAHTVHGRTAYPRLAFVTPTLLVSVGDLGPVRVWNITTQRELCRLALPSLSLVSEVVPSHDGKHVFLAGTDTVASFWMEWEAATGKLVHEEKGLPGALVKLAVSPDGASLAVALQRKHSEQTPGRTEVRLYSGPGWKERRRWQAHRGEDTDECSITFAPDGKTIATGGVDGKVRRWDALTGKEIGPAIDPCQRHSQNVFYLDAATLVTFGWEQTVKLWDATTGKRKEAFPGSEDKVAALAYSPDGRHVAVGSEGPIRIWKAADGTLAAQLPAGRSEVACLHFSPDGRWLLSCDESGQTRLWDWARGGAAVRSFDHHSSLHSGAFSPDGQSLATGDDLGTVHLWAVATAKRLRTLTDSGGSSAVHAVAFSPDGQTLLDADTSHGIRRWSLATGKELHRIEPMSLGHSCVVKGMVLSPGGRWAYSSSYDGSISVWETASGRLAQVLQKRAPVLGGVVSIALSPDGTRLAAAFENDSDKPSVHLWDLTTGKKIALKGHQSGVTQVAFSPDGRRLVSGSDDTTALVWDVTRLSPGGKAVGARALAGLWNDLRANDPKIVYTAVLRGAAGGDAAVACLARHLEPVEKIDTEKTTAWVRQLDSDRFAERQQASRALAGLGPAAELPLREAFEQVESLEVQRHLERILNRQEAEGRRLGNALEMLEMIGTPAARSLLGDLARGDSGARLTHEARLALDRLSKRR
jgi:WD40 repeat protein